MRNKLVTRSFYLELLGFQEFGQTGYDHYLMIERDAIQIHFFAYPDLDPLRNDGQVYIRTDDIEALYHDWNKPVLQLSKLEMKPWGLKEFSLLDPDHNLLTIGEHL